MTNFWDIPNNLTIPDWNSIRATSDWFEAYMPVNLSWWNTFNWNQTINGWLNIDTTENALIIPRMTTAQRNSLTWTAGSIIYNTDSNAYNIKIGSTWWEIIINWTNQTIWWNKTFTSTLVIKNNPDFQINLFSNWINFNRSSDNFIDATSVLWRINLRTTTSPWLYITNLRINSDWTVSSRDLFPFNDNTFTCWTSTNKWSAIYAANWTIQTSDEREKTEIKESILWLDFINALNPVSYKWKVGGNEVEYEEIEVEKEVQETFEEIQKIETIEEINGKFVKVIKEEKIQIPVYDEVDLHNEAWEIIWKHQIPKMIKKIVTEKKEIVTPKLWKRNHFWLLAQEVEEALNWVDFWGLVIDENGKYALRYDQFITPLIKAVQELSARVKELENK